MQDDKTFWTKTELKIYLLLMCASADDFEAKEEIDTIKSKIDSATFERIHTEFLADDEDTRFEKIEYIIGKYEYSPNEIHELKKEIHEVFDADHKFVQKERYLDKVLDNILY